jgi:hypothetical protein
MKPIFSLLILLATGAQALAGDIAVFVRTSKQAQTVTQETTIPGPPTGQKPFKLTITEQTYEIIDLTTNQHLLIEVYEPSHPDFDVKTYFVGLPQPGTLYSRMPIKPAGNFLWFRVAGESSEIALDLDGEDSIDDYFGTGHLLADEQGKAGKVIFGSKTLYLPRTISVVEDVCEQFTSTFGGGANQETGAVVQKITGKSALNTSLTTQANAAPSENDNNLVNATALVVAFLQSKGYIAGTP